MLNFVVWNGQQLATRNHYTFSSKKKRNHYTLIEKFYNQKQNKRGISSPNQYAPTSFFPF